MTFEPIAIIGRSCVLPGAHSPEELWESVYQGRDLLTAANEYRWRLSRRNALGDEKRSTDRTWSDRGGYVEGFAQHFDPNGFSLPAAEIESLDPLFQWLLHTGREALRDAGNPDTQRAGAILGNLSFPSSGLSRYAERVWLGESLADAAQIPQTAPRNRFMSGLPAHLLAQALNLGDIAYALDAACASSLYAIKLACDRLHDRNVDIMLAGAVNRADDLFLHIGFCALQALSPSGRSRPFHRQADGLVPADGAGMVVLKRLDDAQRDGDRILGLIRAVALSNDGRGNGLLAPAEEGQMRAMEEAYQLAGLSPTDISLLECHATGTTVGDKTEIDSMSRVFKGAEGLPIGSLKSNLGHLITVAGVAGLIKVLEAMRTGIRPASLHATDPNEALENSPLRVLEKNEPWECEGPRRAGVSAFGFGGNNAHLIVEEYREDSLPQTSSPSMETLRDPLAIVSVGVIAGDAHGCNEVADKLFAPSDSHPRPCDQVRLSIEGLRFPPIDLQRTLPQQLLLLEATQEALHGHSPLPSARTGVFVGMGCDPEVARYGARWRLADWVEQWGVRDPKWLALAREATVPPLDVPGVLGTMPNISANRLNSQLDLTGRGFTVSAEEISGIRALEIGARALRSGELDMALIGATDLSCEPVSQTALSALGFEDLTGDAAVIIVLKRLADAQSDGDTVLAVMDDSTPAEWVEWKSSEVTARFGHAHASSGLLQVAAATLCCATHQGVGGDTFPEQAGIRLSIDALGGQKAEVLLTPGAPHAVNLPTPPAPRNSLTFPAHPAEIELPPIPSFHPETDSSVLRPAEPNPDQVYSMPSAPHLPPVVKEDVQSAPIEETRPPVPPTQTAPPVTPHLEFHLAATPPEIPTGIDFEFTQRWQDQQAQVAQLHQDFMARQTQLQEQFLNTQQRALEHFVQIYQKVNTEVHWDPVTQGDPRAHEILTPVIPTSPLPQTTESVTSPSKEKPAPPIEPPPIPPASPSPSQPGHSSQPVRGADFQLDRPQLEIHASGKISTLFGSVFEKQDSYPRQVRMPEPPLLLADRVVGLEAEAGSMGLGSIWTETDVQEDSWYLHDGRMPAGLMIEAGQADLMLISYLGIDFTNRSERVYRLLGCELTYHSHLPRPGETLRYDIHVDGHAAQGDIRLFFFHYDCQVDGKPQLTVREGQAGFFSDAELAESEGVIWSPETGERTENPRLDPPAMPPPTGPFSHKQLSDFAAGDVSACFGPGFEATATHTRTPRIAGGRMLFLDQVTHLEPRGGSWGRGYLRAVDPIEPDDWFFDGHFKNDPCMPGTLMFEGCMQAMAFYLTSMGYTLDRDGWRFEPVPEVSYPLRCRGQVTPTSRELVYEIFVDEMIEGPYPTLYADLLCTVDGLKAFHCRRMGLQLVPGFPMDSRPDLLRDRAETRPVAAANGFPFDYASLLSCAWGQPSHAFGDLYTPFDDTRRVARLPGPPYHFMTRVSRIEGEIGQMKPGAVIEIEYDIPPEAWYFRENGSATMPYCVLLEAALQPCGWLASFVGSALTVEHDLFFRNLDGTGTLKTELLPDAGTLRTRVEITNISQSSGMIIESFEVECFLGEVSVYEMNTVFGFFPAEALANQVGLPISDAQAGHLQDECDFRIDLRERPPAYCAGDLKLPSPFLLMLDRVTGYWPEGGRAGLGLFRGEKDVHPDEWFFKAHFHQDPVQPGSLGIEAMIHLLQFAMLEKGMAAGIENPRFEPLALDAPLSWKYRGQVRLHNSLITSTLEILEEGRDDRGAYALAAASLWVDGMRIYEASNLGMRIVSGTLEVPGTREVLDLRQNPWLGDHRPTWTVPALPMMSMVDRIAGAAHREGRVVVGLQNIRVSRWLPIHERTEIDNRIEGTDSQILVKLSNEQGPIAEGQALLAMNWTSGPAPWKSLDEPACETPYSTGTLFHGPAFQILRTLRIGPTGASAQLEAGGDEVPIGTLNQRLLDGATHAIPHDNLHRWCAEIPEDQVAYPVMITQMTIHGPTPIRGSIRCEVRFDGFFGGPRFPAFRVQLIDNQQVWCAFRLVEALFPKGPIGRVAPAERRAFLRDRRYVPGVGLSRADGETTRLRLADIEESNWLEGTVESLYGTMEPAEIARKDHLARATKLHPGALPEGIPLNPFELDVREQPDEVVVTPRGEGALDLTTVEGFWKSWFGLDDTPVHDLFYGMIERFVRRFVIEDPSAFNAVTDRNILYLANHQVAVESLLFSVLSGALAGRPTMTLAKIEHQTTWVGQLIAHSFAYPKMNDPEVIYFFDRNDRRALVQILRKLGARMTNEERSMLVHIEGTRSLSCRTPVEQMASIFIDMSIASDLPIVPVRFLGGLPTEALSHRSEFPVGMGTQDYWLGRPILPETLAAMGAKERKALVIDSINRLGITNAQEEPHVGDPKFASRVRSRLAEKNVPEPQAVLLRILEERERISPETVEILRAVHTDCVPQSSDAEKQRWMAELVRRLVSVE
ncbi:MAG: beta-ketoacyl synthase N-terminal-like domain-containing protein [Planctomycetota bacterium]|nr:beta-ketoacyl synthase N-terminal-like domain-containing protein [Planctomycetota bacterium]